MKGIVITPDNKISIKEFEQPLYKTLGAVVEGHIEHVNPRGLEAPYCMIVNDEGLIENLPINPVGCLFYQTHKHGCPIAGTIVIMQNGFYNGEPDIVGIPEPKLNEMYETFLKRFNLKGV